MTDVLLGRVFNSMDDSYDSEVSPIFQSTNRNNETQN